LFAILCGELTPYRVHLHRRIALEIPELRIATVLYRDSAWSAWSLADPPEINVVRLQEGGLNKVTGPMAGLRRQRFQAARARAWLDENQPAAVLVNGYNHLPLLAAISWCNRRHIPSMLAADSNIKADTATGVRRAVKNFFVPRILRRVGAVLPFGSLGREFFLRYGVDAGRIFLCPYEPDYAAIQAPDESMILEVRRTFGLDPSRKRFVVSSRLVGYKRVDMAIDAFAAVADQRNEWDLVILGDGPLAATLKARVPERLRARVIFTGFVGKQELVTAAYRASHILLHPAEFEPWALVINEGAAAGLAIISSDVVGAAAELVRDGVNGRVVRAGDLQALTTAMAECSEPARLQDMRRASATVLADWRREADPVSGLRQALRSIGIPLTQP
jgi:glycosyltransferase involved in cell wall biosynthesis